MKKTLLPLILIFFTVSLFQHCKKDSIENTDCSQVNASYDKDIRPLVIAQCNTAGCHDSGSPNGDFTTYPGIKAVADNGTLMSRVVDGKTMPPSGALPLEMRKKFKCWINNSSPND